MAFRLGDVQRLPFADETFDGCRADRTLQHVDDPRAALAELVRVARPGARLVVGEPDWETLVVDAPDRTLTRAILNAHCDGHRSGWVGRPLYGLFKEAGLAELVRVAGPAGGASEQPWQDTPTPRWQRAAPSPVGRNSGLLSYVSGQASAGESSRA